MTWPFGDLRPLSYGCILADPPWALEAWSKQGQPRLFDILARQDIRYESLRSYLLVFARHEEDLEVFYGGPPDTVCTPLDAVNWYLCARQER